MRRANPISPIKPRQSSKAVGVCVTPINPNSVQARYVHWVEGLSQENEVGQDCLGKEDGRNAEVKLPFLCFMVKEIHAHECADATAYDGHPDEGSLRYAPLPPAGLPFVNPEDQEGQDIDDDEIDEEYSHGHPRCCSDKTGIYLLFFFAHVLARTTATTDSTTTQETWIVAAKSESFIR